MKTKQSDKTKALIRYFVSTKRITGATAFTMFGVYRLSAVMHRLRRAGWSIDTVMLETPDGVRYGEYRLLDDSRDEQ